MSDMMGIVEEEEGSDGEQVVKPDRGPITLREITSASRLKARLRKNNPKAKMLRKRMSGFERRFSQLAVDNVLVLEKKRIDFVLVYEPSVSGKDLSDKEISQELDRRKFEKLLKLEGFTIELSHIGTHTYAKLFCPFKRLCREAERVKLEMPIKDCNKLEPVKESCISRFLDKHFETDNQDEFVSTQFLMNKIEKFEGHENPNTFFRPALRSFLTHHILINLNIDDLDEDLKDKKKLQENNQSADEKREEQPQPVKRRGLAYMLMRESYTDAFILHEQSERSSIKGDNYLLGSKGRDFKLDSDARKDLDSTWTRPFKFQPLWKIRNYFGERIAFYFAWSGMLCTSLWIPSIVGLGVFLYGVYISATVDSDSSSSTTTSNSSSFVDSVKDLFGDFKQSFDNDVTPFFGLIICVWGTVFLEMWKRKNAELAYEWDVEQFEANEPDRPSFSGTESKRDPVTDDWVWYYPFRLQCVKFCFSFSVLIMMIMLVLISVVAIITYRVIMNVDYCPDMTAAECLIVTTILSSILNAISILILSRFYNVLARKLTEWENHRTKTQFDDALIFKLFAFQFVNSYASCFYIAFFRGKFDSVGFLDGDKYQDTCEGSCMTQLSVQILVLMIVKPFPKFFKDIILVWIKQLWRKYPNCCKCLRKLPCFASNNQVGDTEAQVGLDRNKKLFSHHLEFLRHERLKPTLGDMTLDEFTEKIIQYGFLMLFATSFPLAPLLALLTNMIDLRVDAKRLLWWYRRPIADVAQDIGMWYEILLFVNFCGVVSNAFLIAFTTSWGSQFSTVTKLIIVIGFEHIVFALKYIVAYMIPDTPAHIQLAIRREHYQIQKKMEEPRKDTDYAHLFPVLDIAEEDEDGAGDGTKSGVSSHTSPDHSSKSRHKHKGKGITTTTTHFNFRHSSLSEQSEEEKAHPDLEESFGGYSRVSTSDVTPQPVSYWENTEENGKVNSPGMRLPTPVYRPPNPRDLKEISLPSNRPLSGHSTTEC